MKTRIKRSRGRPRAKRANVGRDAIVAAARQLLDEVPPHRATVTAIARRAGVDPALLRYYFSSREQLLLAVIEDVLTTWFSSHPVAAGGPAARLAAQVGGMFDFSQRTRFMQRLMIDECAGSKSAMVRRRVLEMNAAAVHSYALLLHEERGKARDATDPLFMFVAIIGLCEFFAASQAMILPLAPAGVKANELAARYRKFIVSLVLDGLRSRVEPWSAPRGNRPASRA
jgi:AcrR family transcriptional regulator